MADSRTILSLRLLRMAALAMAMALPAVSMAADAFPQQPVRIVVPYAPGGGVDIVTRLVSQKMGEALAQPMIVDNRPGASTNIGMESVTRAEPDGYTLLTASNTLASNAALFSNLSFDPANDLVAVGSIGHAPLVVVVPAASPFKTLDDLVQYGKQHPDKLSYGSAGNGSSGHLASELLKLEAGFDALHVPYKGGSPAVTDLLGERISFMSINPLEVAAHVQAGRLRALAVLSDEPTPLLPALPTTAALGYPNAAATVWWGVVAPKGTPANVIKTLDAALVKALADPEVRNRFADMGATVTPGSADEFAAFVKRESEKWTKVIRTSKITAG